MFFRRNRAKENRSTVIVTDGAPYHAPPVAEAPTEVWVPVPQARSRHRFRFGGGWTLVLFGGAMVMALAFFVALALGVLVFYNSDYIMPGVQTVGVSLGGMTTADATTTLQENWQQRTITLEAGDTTLGLAPADLGITLDVEATAARAYEQGRSLATLESLVSNGGRMLPVWEIDLATAETSLQTLKPQLDAAPVNAGLQIAGGRVEATPPQPGRTVDIAATVTLLQQTAGQVALDGRLPLATTPVQPAITDVSTIVEEVNQLLTTAVTVRAYDPVNNESLEWTVAPEEWIIWVTPVVDTAAAAQINWTLDGDRAKSFLNTQTTALLGAGRHLQIEEAVDQIAAALTAGSNDVSLRVYHEAQQHTVQPGETISSIGRHYGIPYPWIQQANPSVGDSLSVGQVLTIPSPDELLPLPVVENKRIIVSISEQKTWVYENSELKWEWPTSTGIASSPTSPGIFQIRSHELNAYAGNWNLWMPHFMGIYQPVPTSDFMNGFHGFPTRGGSTLLWTGDLGHPVTYGCILISSENAERLYNWAEEGVVVEIQP